MSSHLVLDVVMSLISLSQFCGYCVESPCDHISLPTCSKDFDYYFCACLRAFALLQHNMS